MSAPTRPHKHYPDPKGWYTAGDVESCKGCRQFILCTESWRGHGIWTRISPRKKARLERRSARSEARARRRGERDQARAAVSQGAPQ